MIDGVKKYNGFATPSFILEGSDLFDEGKIIDKYSETEDGSKLLIGWWNKSVMDGLIHMQLHKPVTELMLEREREVVLQSSISDEESNNYKRSLAEASESHSEPKTSYNNTPKKQMVLDPVTKQFKFM